MPRSTLSDRLGDRDTLATAHQQQQRLSPSQEDLIIMWITQEHYDGYPTNRARVREMASRVLRNNRDDAPLGRKWILSFLKRNPHAASKMSKTRERVQSIVSNVKDAGNVEDIDDDPVVLTIFKPMRLHNRRSKRILQRDARGGPRQLRQRDRLRPRLPNQHPDNQESKKSAWRMRPNSCNSMFQVQLFVRSSYFKW